MGYDGPNYTQTPNLLLDEHLPDMGYAELKVVLVIVRQTMGWHKETDQLSISQLEEKTGLSNRSVIDGTRKALERGVIHRVRKGGSYSYRMVVKGREEGSHVGGEVSSQGVKQVHRGSEVSSQVGGEVTSHTKETVKETTTKEKRESAPAREEALSVIDDYFKASPKPFQRDKITAIVDDLDRWRAVLEDLATRGYSGSRAVGYAIKNYENPKPTHKEKTNGRTERAGRTHSNSDSGWEGFIGA